MNDDTSTKSKSGENKGNAPGDFAAAAEPFSLFKDWLEEAERHEPVNPTAMALATVDSSGLPNVRTVLLKGLDAPGSPDRGFVFYTNYESAKARELDSSQNAAFVMHWKSLRRQIRVRGVIEKEDGVMADEYYASRSLSSRLGAWASHQSQPLGSRGELMAEVAKITASKGINPQRPPFWGGYRIRPSEIEFWADGKHRLHDRFVWRRSFDADQWQVTRLQP